MIKYFCEAWDDTGLTPLQKLIWLKVCDTGMSQELVWPLEDWLSWTGCDSVHDLMAAIQFLHETGRVVSYGIQAPGGIYVRSRFAVEVEEENTAPRQRDPNAYTKTKISHGLRRRVLERDEYRCVYCGTHKDLTLDHVEPEIHGGATTEDNLRTACKSCNSSKGTKSLQEWLGRGGVQ